MLNFIFIFHYREKYTLELLSKFRNKLEKVKEKDEATEGESSSKAPSQIKAVNDNNDEDIAGGKQNKKFESYRRMLHQIFLNLYR